MADVQDQFEIFHKEIRVDYDMDKTLRDKRDAILKRIRKKLADAKRPGFRELHQGSYKLRTGTKPVGSIEYDIDIGLRFDIDSSEHTAAQVRNWVFEAVDGLGQEVKEKPSCIRVVYGDGYHIDLVIYACNELPGGTESFELASKSNGWRAAAPPALEEHIQTARTPYEGTEDGRTSTDQFRRVVRCLKRWYDEAIPKDSKDKPTGLAYTLLVAQHGSPRYDLEGRACDLELLRSLCSLASQAGRIAIYKPTPENEDLLARLSDAAMDRFKERLQALGDALGQAADAVDPVAACQTLAAHFGSDFPIPEPEGTGSRTAGPAIVPASSSA